MTTPPNTELFTILDKIYTARDARWIAAITQIDGYVVLKFLSMDVNLSKQVRWLNNYVFYLEPKMFISLCWSVVPKVSRRPFTPYISKTKSVRTDVDLVLSHWRYSL